MTATEFSPGTASAGTASVGTASVGTASVGTASVGTASKESAEILDAVRAIAGSLAAGVAEDEAARRLPRDSVTAVRKTRLTTLRVPARYGGPGGSLRDLFGAIIGIATANPNLAQGLRSHFGFIERLLSRDSAEAERAREWWFPEVLSGKLFGLASAELGIVSPAEFTTSLRSGDDGVLVLDGRKYYSTGGLFADSIEVIAAGGEGKLVSLVVPANREGVRLVDDFDAMGQRTTASGTTIFTGVRVEPDEILEELDWTDPDRPLDYLGGFYQLYLASVAAGIAVNVFRDAAEYVRHRARPAVHGLTGDADRAAKAKHDLYRSYAEPKACWRSVRTARFRPVRLRP